MKKIVFLYKKKRKDCISKKFFNENFQILPWKNVFPYEKQYSLKKNWNENFTMKKCVFYKKKKNFIKKKKI